MWFFSENLSQLNKEYSVLFGIEDGEGEDGEGEGGEESTTGNTFSDKWGWIYQVDTVSETVRVSWDVVFKMNIIEFLNILCYTKDKKEEEKRQMLKMKNKLKNGG